MPAPYTRLQLDDRERNEGKTRCPPGVTPPPYIPSSAQESGDEALFVVEAPPKALAMASNGYPNTIGCGGIYAGIFEKKDSSRIQAPLLPFLRSSRPVYILFDAGRTTNPSVAHAEARIARALIDHGCPVRIVELPRPDDGGDGPDDFLALHGADAMQALVARARPADPAAWAAAMIADGPAVSRRALEHMPFLAALTAGGPAVLDSVADVLKAFFSKAEIRAARKGFDDSLRVRRDARRGGGVDGAAHPEGNAGGASVFQRGDEVELAQEHLRRLGPHIVFAEGQTYRYVDGAWRELTASKQRKALGGFAGALVAGRGEPYPLSLSDQKIRGALSHFEDLVARPDFFAQAPRGLCFENGFLLLGKNRVDLVPHATEHHARHRYPFAFDRSARCPRWLRYLESTWETDADSVDKIGALQEFVGATLFGIMPRFKTALMLFGDADSGKSTCLSVLRGLVPRDAACSVSLHDFEHEYNRAHLAGKLLNLVAEVPATELVRSESFKAIVAGDVTKGRNVCQRPFDFNPVAAHVFAANTLPHVNDRSEGVWTRWLVLTFNRRFLKAAGGGAGTATVGLAEAILADEVPGIVAWAVEGLKRLLANAGAFTRPASSQRTLAEWRRESNPVALFFDAELLLDPGESISTGDLYRAYRAWCDANGFAKPLSHPSFGKMLHALLRERSGRGEVTKMLHGSTIFVGVRPKETTTRSADYSRVFS